MIFLKFIQSLSWIELMLYLWLCVDVVSRDGLHFCWIYELFGCSMENAKIAWSEL
ncbi:hypothetical protein C1646_711016 [Rhizophagus diaphanus]|nr:hypothetical protein C1646_711016 [Rhizophagus diaphanus] [Rhizophagus sp. MUCL 43196]